MKALAIFRKRGDTWEYRIRYYDSNRKRKEKSKGGYKTKKEAQIEATAEEMALNQTGVVENSNILLKDYLKEWLEIYKKPVVKPITYGVLERNVRLNIIPRFGNYKLKDIKRSEYQQWINELVNQYSIGTIRRIHSLMNTAMSNAVWDFHYLRTNPLQKIKIPIDDSDKKLKFYSIKELDNFLQALTIRQKNAKYQHSKQYYALFTLLARTGLRIGEALALTWDDLDLNVKTVSVDKTLVYPLNSTPYLSKPKTKNSIRTILLDDLTVKVLTEHRVNQKEVCGMYRNYRASDDNLVFHQHDGRWLRTNVVRDYFKVNCKRANVPVLSPHALRHSHAVHLLEAGANIKYVSKRLGHASIKTTADTYLHITEKIENDSMQMYVDYMK